MENTISFNNGYGTTYTFEIVDRIPKGYEVWNIDFDKLGKDLIPLCEVDEHFNVNQSTLKAIKVSDIYDRFAIKMACAWGFNTDELRVTLKEWGKDEDEIEDRIRAIRSAERILNKLR